MYMYTYIYILALDPCHNGTGLIIQNAGWKNAGAMSCVPVPVCMSGLMQALLWRACGSTAFCGNLVVLG